MECREVVDSIKEAPKCIECELLQQQFQENPGGKPMRRPGLIFAAILGEYIIRDIKTSQRTLFRAVISQVELACLYSSFFVKLLKST